MLECLRENVEIFVSLEIDINKMPCGGFGRIVKLNDSYLDLILLSLLGNFPKFWELSTDVRLVEGLANRVSKHYFINFGCRLTHFCKLDRNFAITARLFGFNIWIWVILNLRLILKCIDYPIKLLSERIVRLVYITTECHGRRFVFLIAVHVIIVTIATVFAFSLGLGFREDVFRRIAEEAVLGAEQGTTSRWSSKQWTTSTSTEGIIRTLSSSLLEHAWPTSLGLAKEATTSLRRSTE